MPEKRQKYGEERRDRERPEALTGSESGGSSGTRGNVVLDHFEKLTVRRGARSATRLAPQLATNASGLTRSRVFAAAVAGESWRPVGGVVVGDDVAVVPRMSVEPCEPVDAEDEDDGREAVGECEVGPDDRGAGEFGCGEADTRVDEMRPALICR